jgi:hypothetical protein
MEHASRASKSKTGLEASDKLATRASKHERVQSTDSETIDTVKLLVVVSMKRRWCY